MKGTSIGTTWRSYVAEAPAWGIVLGALAVSATTQVVTVHHHGFALWEAIVWGGSTDFGTIACLFLAREGAHRGTPTWGAWVLSVACAALSVQYNVVAGVEAHDWLAVEAHVWMPALALGVWYWLLHGRHRRWTAAVQVKEPAPVVHTGQQDRTADSPRDSRADSADIVSEGAFRQAVREVGIGQKELAARLGVTTRSIRRYQKRWPDALGVAVLRSEVS